MLELHGPSNWLQILVVQLQSDLRCLYVMSLDFLSAAAEVLEVAESSVGM